MVVVLLQGICICNAVIFSYCDVVVGLNCNGMNCKKGQGNGCMKCMFCVLWSSDRKREGDGRRLNFGHGSLVFG